MKKISCLLSLFTFCCLPVLYAQVCSGVTAETIAPQPQSGQYNYFGVKVSLNETYGQNVTVQGYIYEEGNYNTNTPFSLTIFTGYLSNETAINFFQTCPTCTAEVTITSVSPCPFEEHFDQVVRSFVGSFTLNMYDYINTFTGLTDQEAFIDALQNCDQEESTVDSIYTAYGLSFASMVNAKNAVDNDILNLTNSLPFLSEMSESNAWSSVLSKTDEGFSSNDASWTSTKSSISSGLSSRMAPPGLTWDEVYGCIKQAVIVTVGAGLSLYAISQMTNISAIVTAVSKTLLRNFGWVGAAIMAIDLAACLYAEAND